MADLAALQLRVIPLADGATLRRKEDDWWFLYRGESQIRALTEYECEFVSCALREAAAALRSPAREETDPQWVILHVPGKTPQRKGPYNDTKLMESMLRELYALHPDGKCTVVNMPHSGYPEDGREWLSIYGDRRRKLPASQAPEERRKGQRMQHTGEYCSTDPVAADVCESMHNDKVDQILGLEEALTAIRALVGGYSNESKEIVAIIDKAIQEHGL